MIGSFGMALGGGYRKVKLELKREINNPETQNYMIAASVFYTLLNRPGYYNGQTLSAVYYHCNPTLEQLFELECTKMKKKYPGDEGDPILAFHGTPNDDNIDKIARNNFDLGKLKDCWYGWGVYLSEFPDVSIGYAGDTQKLLLCKVLPGKSRDGDCGQSGPGNLCRCDSHRIGASPEGRGTELVINNVNRILPCFELHLN